MLLKQSLFLIIAGSLVMCDNNESKNDDDEDPVDLVPKFTIKPSVTYQEMVGFGGALTWYSNYVATSPKSAEIYDLMFNDLGMDILRLKNWYYPNDYPANKSPENMVTEGDKTMFNVTRTFFEKAKAANPEIKVLFSSWGPPVALKSNNKLNEGSLKKDPLTGKFMYDEYAQYWVDILDNIQFNPDYIGMQNEPGYSNPGWTTCVWGVNETSTLAAFDIAFTKVYDRIKNRSFVPEMIAPESENIPAFLTQAQKVKSLSYCPIYGYHPYNFNESSDLTQTASALKSIATSFGDKPNFMTEYSGMSWFKTARFMHQTLKYANTSAYIYWMLVWGNIDTKDQAMIYVDPYGNYTVNSFYYLIKHFSKFIDKGYKRIDLSVTHPQIEATAYINPSKTQITVVAINTDSFEKKYSFDIENYTIKSVKAYQSVTGDYFKDLGTISTDQQVRMPAGSITTFVLSL